MSYQQVLTVQGSRTKNATVLTGGLISFCPGTFCPSFKQYLKSTAQNYQFTTIYKIFHIFSVQNSRNSVFAPKISPKCVGNPRPLLVCLSFSTLLLAARD